MTQITQITSNRDGFLRSLANAESLLNYFGQLSRDASERLRGDLAGLDQALLESAHSQIQRALFFFLAEHVPEEALASPDTTLVTAGSATLWWLKRLSKTEPQVAFIYSALSGDGWQELWHMGDRSTVDRSGTGKVETPASNASVTLIASDSGPGERSWSGGSADEEVLEQAIKRLLELDSELVQLNQEC